MICLAIVTNIKLKQKYVSELLIFFKFYTGLSGSPSAKYFILTQSSTQSSKEKCINLMLNLRLEAEN